MCGFLGEFLWDGNSLIDRESFKSILSLSKSRGPDNTAIWETEKVRLGFNRLAIQDLSEFGNQPMTDLTSSCGMVFNGEIYNHLEIRKKLEATGQNFRGHSDTETLFNAIMRWGFEETIVQLDGMFSVAFYDGTSHTLKLARDFAGIKPLFAGLFTNGIVFASQYDQVCKHPKIHSNSIDPEVLRLYLEQHFMPAPFGLLKNTFQLEPGEIVTISSNGHKEHHRYWTFPSSYNESIFNKDEALDIIDHQLSEAVHAEMISDVPLGTFLSGGIDSPLITSMAKEFKPGLQTFSIGSDSTKHDESEDARGYAKQIGVENFCYMMDGESAVGWWEKAMQSIHEPIADYSILPTFVVSSFARSKVTVALSGDGGDELFYGYERFSSVAKNLRFQRFPYLMRAGIYLTDKHIFNKRHFNSGLLGSGQAAGHRNLHSRTDREFLRKLENQLPGFRTPDKYRTYDYPNTSNEKELLQNMRKGEFYGMMQKTLRKVDLASMENSLEVRVPFLKKSFIESSFAIDYHLSYNRQGGSKQILKDLLNKRLPEGIVDGQKRGFTIPLTGWSKGPLKESFGDMLTSSVICDLLGKDNISALWDTHLKNEKNNTWSLFTIYSLSKWLEEQKR